MFGIDFGCRKSILFQIEKTQRNKKKNLFDKIENEEDEINAKEYKFEAPMTIEQGRHSL